MGPTKQRNTTTPRPTLPATSSGKKSHHTVAARASRRDEVRLAVPSAGKLPKTPPRGATATGAFLWRLTDPRWADDALRQRCRLRLRASATASARDDMPTLDALTATQRAAAKIAVEAGARIMNSALRRVRARLDDPTAELLSAVELDVPAEDRAALAQLQEVFDRCLPPAGSPSGAEGRSWLRPGGVTEAESCLATVERLTDSTTERNAVRTLVAQHLRDARQDAVEGGDGGDSTQAVQALRAAEHFPASVQAMETEQLVRAIHPSSLERPAQCVAPLRPVPCGCSGAVVATPQGEQQQQKGELFPGFDRLLQQLGAPRVSSALSVDSAEVRGVGQGSLAAVVLRCAVDAEGLPPFLRSCRVRTNRVVADDEPKASTPSRSRADLALYPTSVELDGAAFSVPSHRTADVDRELLELAGRHLQYGLHPVEVESALRALAMVCAEPSCPKQHDGGGGGGVAPPFHGRLVSGRHGPLAGVHAVDECTSDPAALGALQDKLNRVMRCGSAFALVVVRGSAAAAIAECKQEKDSNEEVESSRTTWRDGAILGIVELSLTDG